MISRRELIVLTGGTFAWPLAALAQQPGTIRQIGLLDYAARDERVRLWDAFRQRMRELGYVEGQAVVSELVNLPFELIVAASTPAPGAPKQATDTIPIVMTSTADPVGQGFVASLSRPGGNVTGLGSLNADLSGKRLGLLRQGVTQGSRSPQVFAA